MANAPMFNLDMIAFQSDPYPQLERMRTEAPVAFVPELNMHVMSRHRDIFEKEKLEFIFSSAAPGSKMEQTVGRSMLIKDGDAHTQERKAINPSLSPMAMKEVWTPVFESIVDRAIDDVIGEKSGDLLSLLAMPIAADMLINLVGLTTVSRNDIVRLCNGLIAGITNLSDDSAITAESQTCSEIIDCIVEEARALDTAPTQSALLGALIHSGASDEQIKANLKLTIAGGLNEPRAGLSGTIAALLTHPDELEKCKDGTVNWRTAFEEYGRWNAPIGVAQRTVTEEHRVGDVTFERGDIVGLMWRSGNRDEDVFKRPEVFDVSRSDVNKAMTFGSGPHFCAGAWASRTLIGDIALPKIFDRFKELRLAEPASVRYDGWMFRHPLAVTCEWRN